MEKKFDLSTIGLPEGNYDISVIAQSSNYENSFSSNVKNYTITEGIEYAISGDENHYICAGIGDASTNDVVIASVKNGLPVKEIGVRAFYNCTDLTSVAIPSSVANIGEYAFYNCSGLTKIVIPDSVIEIGIYAFQNCVGINDVEIGKNVAAIGEFAFGGCGGFTNVEYNGCKYRGDKNNPYLILNFVPDANLDTYSFHRKTQIIKSRVCYGFSSLKYLVLPLGLKGIGDHAFYECVNLQSVIIPEGVTHIGAGAFAECEKLGSIVIPDTVTVIGAVAFSGCSSLKSVVIGNSVKQIGMEAFYYCDSLETIQFRGTVAQWKAIVKDKYWIDAPDAVINCSDGIVPVKELVDFTISGSQYYAEENMTWREWVSSKYNTDGFRVVNHGWGDVISPKNKTDVVAYSQDGRDVSPDEVINSHAYKLSK